MLSKPLPLIIPILLSVLLALLVLIIPHAQLTPDLKTVRLTTVPVKIGRQLWKLAA